MAEEKILSQKEIDELLKTLGDQPVKVHEQSPSSDKNVQIYDFKKPHRLSGYQINIARSILESCSKFIKSYIEQLIRTQCDCSLISVEQLNFDEFLNSLSIPTCVFVTKVQSSHVPMITVFSTAAVFPMIGRILGSSKEFTHSFERPLTDFEWEIAGKIFEQFVESLNSSTKYPFNQYTVLTRESNPRLINIFSTIEPVISATYEFSVMKSKGLISIAFPLEIINKILSQLASANIQIQSNPKQFDPKILNEASFTLSSGVEGFTTTVSELMLLQEGSVIKFQDDLKKLTTVSIEGKRKFAAEIGEMNKGTRAAKIIGNFDPSSEGIRTVNIENKAAKETTDILNGANLIISIEIANKQIQFREAAALSEGDIIKFDKHVDQEIKAFIEGEPRATGKIVHIGEKFGFQFTGFISSR